MPARRRVGIQADYVAPDQAGLFFDLVGVVLEGIHAAAPLRLTTRGESVQHCI